MSEKIKIDKINKLIIVRSVGDIRSTDILGTLDAVKELVAQDEYNGVLVDAQQVESLPGEGEIYNLMESFPRNLRIAILVSKDQKTRSLLEFMEELAYKRGLFVKVFLTEKKARDWLIARSF